MDERQLRDLSYEPLTLCMPRDVDQLGAQCSLFSPNARWSNGMARRFASGKLIYRVDVEGLTCTTTIMNNLALSCGKKTPLLNSTPHVG